MAAPSQGSGAGDVTPPGAELHGALKKGDTVGRYLVLDPLGAGAMGVVYAAYDPELDRKIAIKVLRPHEGRGDPRRRQERLVREAQAMARLSDPNVGAIYDVGPHGDQVFLAIEFLSGGTLRRWITDKQRPWREVVKMFIEVGKGLAGAHAEGLIHRDFKPDNVLLDKNGVPKVVDFGLVRLTSAALDRSTTGSIETQTTEDDGASPISAAQTAIAPLTRTGALTGTPAYMAPEQFLNGPIDARTDQFAFCIALYEALYGERPFAGDSLASLAVSVANGRVNAPPKDAHVPAWIRRILLRGLSVDPAQRFSSMETLAAALANDPARRTRNWTLFGATVVTMASLAGLSHRLGSKPRTMCAGAAHHLAGIWEAGTGASQRKTAIQKAFLGSGKSYAAQAYSGVGRLFDQFVQRWTGMYADACQATHVRGEQSAEVLDLRMACLRQRLGKARALSDVFASADGKVVENAVSAAAALPSLDHCADVPLLRAVVKPPEDPSTRKRVEDLRVDLARLVALRDSGQCGPATEHAAPLINGVRAVGYQPLLAETLYESAQIGTNCGDVAGALPRFKEAYEVATGSRNDEVAAQASALIAPFAMNRLGQASVAREWLSVARGAVTRLGRETLADAMLAQASGMLALSERNYERALAAADHSIAVTRKLLGPDDPLTIQWEANKVDWLQKAGRLDEALRTAVRAREHLESVLGHEHPRVAYVSINEGEVLHLLGRYVDAEAAYRRAADLFRQSGADRDVLSWALSGLGLALLGQGRASAAVTPLEEALAIRLEKGAPGPQLGETRFALARALWSRPEQRRRALALGVSARNDYGDDTKAVAEIDEWLAQARARRNPDANRGCRAGGDDIHG